MRRNRSPHLRFASALVCFCLLLLFTQAVFTQQTTVDEGIRLYREGRYREAVSSLEKAVKQKELKTNAELWNFLGLAYIESSNIKKAIPALQKAVRLSPTRAVYAVNLGYAFLRIRKLNNSQKELERALRLEPNNVAAIFLRGTSQLWENKPDRAIIDADLAIQLEPTNDQGYLLKSDALVAKFGTGYTYPSPDPRALDFLKQAVDVLTLGKDLVGKNGKEKLLAAELESKSTFYQFFLRRLNADPIDEADPQPGVTPLKILTKQKASYTDSARQANVQGTVTLATLFGASGKIEHVLVLKGLGYGLDEEAIRAVRTITFEPKKVNGNPVSSVRPVSFTFNIY